MASRQVVVIRYNLHMETNVARYVGLVRQPDGVGFRQVEVEAMTSSNAISQLEIMYGRGNVTQIFEHHRSLSDVYSNQARPGYGTSSTPNILDVIFGAARLVQSASRTGSSRPSAASSAGSEVGDFTAFIWVLTGVGAYFLLAGKLSVPMPWAIGITAVGLVICAGSRAVQWLLALVEGAVFLVLYLTGHLAS
jgi:hypothetical protein